MAQDMPEVNMTSGMTSQMLGFSASSTREVGMPLLHDPNLEMDEEALTECVIDFLQPTE